MTTPKTETRVEWATKAQGWTEFKSEKESDVRFVQKRIDGTLIRRTIKTEIVEEEVK